MSATTHTDTLLRVQQRILEMIARREDLDATLDALCRLVEDLIPDCVSSIMRIEPGTGALCVRAAPRIPPEVIAELDGLVPTERSGSCGTAVFTGKPVLVADVTTSELWADMQDLARRSGIRACWSTPVFGRQGEALGSFAVSRSIVGAPDELQLAILETGGHLAGIALEWERDEKNLREQKVLLDNILAGTDDPIFAKDTERRYLLANPAQGRVVGRAPESIIGLTDEDLHPEQTAAKCRAVDEEIFRTRESRLYEVDFDIPGRGICTYMIHKSPLLDRDGNLRGLVGVARDITALQQAEAAIRQTQKLESLGVLAGGIAHDFNNLLTGVLGNADLALHELDGAATARHRIEELKKAAIRASELTSQMLAYSGKGEFIKEPVHLPTLVQEVETLIASSISKKAKLTIHTDDDLPNTEADPTQMRQLLMNMLTNASEALDDQPGEIRVSMRAFGNGNRPPAGDPAGACAPAVEHYVNLEISDTGSGMDTATKSRVFDPFFSTKFAGRGLGLAAVQGIVRGHGGTIRVESEPGKGTTFCICLPATTRQLERSTEPTAPAWHGKGTVLVVDDEESVRDVMSQMLAAVDLHVVTAVDGQDAVEVFRARADEIDVVLLDLTTPRLNGHEAYQRLCEIRSDVRVILTSGYTEADATRAFDRAELAGFLKKPFLAADLVAMIRQALG